MTPLLLVIIALILLGAFWRLILRGAVITAVVVVGIGATLFVITAIDRQLTSPASPQVSSNVHAEAAYWMDKKARLHVD